MNIKRLIEIYRARAGDTVVPYWVSDKTLIAYFDEAQKEACRRALLLRDSTTNGVARFVVRAGNALINTPRSIIKITRYKLASNALPLGSCTVAEMDADGPGWEAQTGRPVAVVTDYQTGALRLYPIPVSDDTLTLTVARISADLEALNDEPEINDAYHLSLVDWVLYRIFSQPDSETFNPEKAKESHDRFVQEFGGKVSAKTEQWAREQNNTFAEPLA